MGGPHGVSQLFDHILFLAVWCKTAVYFEKHINKRNIINHDIRFTSILLFQQVQTNVSTDVIKGNINPQ